MRLFFGLECPMDVALAIADWRERQLPPMSRPVPLKNFHITLAFLGETRQDALEQLILSVDDCVPCPADRLVLDRVGYWPKPGIYWLGPTAWPAALEQMAGDLDKLRQSGQRQRGRSFCPHITLFRRCAHPPPAPTRTPGLQFEFDRLVLFESRPGRKGVTYRPVQEWCLPVA